MQHSFPFQMVIISGRRRGTGNLWPTPTSPNRCYWFPLSEEVTSSGKLKVIPSLEPLFTRKLDVLEVIEGRNARFDCKVSGTPPPKVLWSHFDQPLVESEDVRMVQEGGRHSLIISHVTSDDEGFYTIRARNAHGEAENSAELYIQEPRGRFAVPDHRLVP
uniref:Ig-like domain-containing protein n=1 Tax=Poecilia reticulata TaxID=8081 RepID=A0A3P9Q7K8_POERE